MYKYEHVLMLLFFFFDTFQFSVKEIKRQIGHTSYQCLFILIDKINKSTFQEICSAVNFLDI